MVRKVFAGVFYIFLSICLFAGAIGSAIYNLDSGSLSSPSTWSSDSRSYSESSGDEWGNSDDSGSWSWGNDSGSDSWGSDSGSDSWGSGSDSGSWDSWDSGSDSGSWDSDW